MEDHDCLVCRFLPGLIAVEHDIDAFRIARDKRCLLLREGGTERGDGRIDSCLMHRNDIEVAFNEDGDAALLYAFQGLIDAEEVMLLGIDRGIR